MSRAQGTSKNVERPPEEWRGVFGTCRLEQHCQVIEREADLRMALAKRFCLDLDRAAIHAFGILHGAARLPYSRKVVQVHCNRMTLGTMRTLHDRERATVQLFCLAVLLLLIEQRRERSGIGGDVGMMRPKCLGADAYRLARERLSPCPVARCVFQPAQVVVDGRHVWMIRSHGSLGDRERALIQRAGV